MAALGTAELNSIERQAPRAPRRMLEGFVERISCARPHMDDDSGEHADALLLKLRHLIDEQLPPLARPMRRQEPASPRARLTAPAWRFAEALPPGVADALIGRTRAAQPL